MAKFIPGPLVSEIRNALGAQVFSRNQFGAFTRARVDPDNTETPDRLIAKEAIQSAAAAWGTTLTDSQRSAWNAFADALRVRARSAILTHNNGVSLFTKLWVLAYWWSGNFLTDPPADLDTPALTAAALTSDGVLSELNLTFAPTPVPAGQIIMVYATESLNAGITRPHRWFKPIAMLTAGATSPYNLWTEYETAHGTPVDGKKIFTRTKTAFIDNNFPTVPLQSVTLISGVPEVMLETTVVLTDAQIKALPTTPVNIVAAIPGIILAPFAAVVQCDPSAGAYGNISATIANFMAFGWGAIKGARVLNSLILNGVTISGLVLPSGILLDAIPPTARQIQLDPVTTASLTNVPITWNCVNAAGNFTGGNAANTMRVTILYTKNTPI